ncbi:glycosyltransferase family 2 protein [Vibrio astriarenae]|uniref:glycosyltransferase family 2 protein n=1 Tax=Vibrio astriarenae TaxID=1481923 RepID=UPI0037355B34
MFNKIISKVKTSVLQKDKVNYLAGLWINFDLSSKDKVAVNIKFNGQYVAKNKWPTTQEHNQWVYDLHLPVVTTAKAIQSDNMVHVSIEDETGKERIAYRCSVDNIYQNEFKYIVHDINATLSHFPLINTQSVHLLSEEQKLSVIKNVFDANLEKDVQDTLALLVEHLHDYDSVAETEAAKALVYNKEFISLLLNDAKFDVQHPYFSMIKIALNAQLYLEAKSLIEFAKINDETKQVLLAECLQKDAEHFDFVEHFPEDEQQGLEKWQALTPELQQQYWPLLACGFEYKRQYHRITQYQPNYHWFTDKQSDDRNALIKAILQSGETKWFGMSVLVNEFENGSSTQELIPHLQEFIWANWNQDYINIDSFCYVMMGLLQKSPNHLEYKNLCEIITELFNSRVHKNTNDLYRQCLIECVTHYLNYGVTTMNWAFGPLAQLVRPYYAFDDYFINHIDYDQIAKFDQTYHQFSSAIYTKAKAVKAFFLTLKHDTPPTEQALREQFNHLLFLRDNNIYFTEKWILALSRYCQLHKLETLYPELCQLHEKIDDFYGALILAQDETEQLRLEALITQSGKDAKRKDAYWFERSLQARLEGVEARLAYISELHQFLLNTQVGPTSPNEDLVQLLSSEITHYLMQGEAFANIESYLPLINEAYVAGHTAIQVTNWIINGDINRFSYKTLENQCGAYGELSWLIEQFGQREDNLLTEEALTALLVGIKQHYVYPYIQVMVYSCNAYEKTRHKVIRESWLPKLQALDIDYCFVVGDADESHMDGDMMRLRVLDTYEELPHKSVEMFRFAHTNSHHRYYYKLDDDCVLNINAMFGDPAFLNQAYFGRVVKRPLGGVDRSWHHVKSRTQEAKETLDLSPEYSEYCDGSTGYILSTWAAEQLTIQAQDESNEQLVNCSYFEDKLIGDLLTKAGVAYSDDGYNCVIRRKVAAGRDLQMWDYGLLPTISNNIKVLHTEDDDYRLMMGKTIEQPYDNKPNLIYRDVAKVMNPEWLSGEEQAPVLDKLAVDEAAIAQAQHLAIIVGKNEQELLPNLLSYHRNIGIEHFIFVDNCSNDSSIEYMLEQSDVSVFVATQEYKHSRFAVNWQETLLSHYGLGRWVLIIDSDELYTYKDSENNAIHSITHKADQEQATAMFAPMIDFYPKGDLASADITGEAPFYEVCDHYDDLNTMDKDIGDYYGPFSNSPSWHGGLRKRIFGAYNPYPQPNYVNQKYNLVKYQPNMRFIEGLHYMYGHQVTTQPAAIMHFKYHAGFYDKVEREIKSGQHWNGATEYKRYAQQLENKKNNSFFSIVVSREKKHLTL